MHIMSFIMEYAFAFILGLIIIGSILASREAGFWAIVSFIGAGYLYSQQTTFSITSVASDIGTWIAANALYFVGFAVVYPAIGILISRFLWVRDVTAQKEEYLEFKAEFLRRRNVETLEDLCAEDLDIFKRDATNYKIMTPMKNKALIVARIAWWPVYVLEYLFLDILRDMALRVYRAASKMFIRISEKNSEEYMADMKVVSNKESSSIRNSR